MRLALSHVVRLRNDFHLRAPLRRFLSFMHVTILPLQGGGGGGGGVAPPPIPINEALMYMYFMCAVVLQQWYMYVHVNN